VTDELGSLIKTWLPLPDVAERLGLDVGRVRRLLQDRMLVGVRRGQPGVMCVPEDLILDGEPLPDLKGTLSVLADSGFTDEEALRWLFTPDDTLPGTPVENLRRGHKKTEVRRRAQALAL
jgi:hypothetical protein